METKQEVQSSRDWREVWRKGVAPRMTIRELELLLEGLEKDDPALIQGATTEPPPIMCVQDHEVEAGCLIAYPAWKSMLEEYGSATVAEVEEQFAQVCYETDTALEEAAAIRYLLNWYDDTERRVMRLEMIPEVRLAIEEHKRLMGGK